MAESERITEADVHKLTIPAEEGQLSRVRDFVADVCEQVGFSTRETNNTKLAVDEACTNIIKHAYTDDPGEILISIKAASGSVDISIVDTGKQFDFAGVEDPDLDQYVETGKKGGLGVFLINRLMDSVEYHTGESSNELILKKRSHAAVSRALPGKIRWSGSLRYKFTLRASLGLFLIIASIWGYTFLRQTHTLREQRTNLWLEKRGLAASLANKSNELLMTSKMYSVEQTTLTAFVSRMMARDTDLAHARVVNLDGTILSSGTIDEIFTTHSETEGTLLLEDDDGIRWLHIDRDGQSIREIQYPVRVRNPESGRVLTLGNIYLGVHESEAQASIKDPRLLTTLIMLAFFLLGVLLISALVSVFVKPIQVLTDGVRAIGQGTLDGKISVEGPAEIGAIASVFNEITEKFKKAQESVLEQEKLQKEIEVAKQIQHALLPKRNPDVSGYDIAPYYQAAKEVGGDYYDFVEVDEDTLGVVVADVSGKGVPGSLVMTMIRTALRMEARGNKNASDVMSKMNDFVTDDMKKGMFVTMFYVILDSKNRIISYASAGHNPMILYRSESNETFFLNPKGFPVGISLPDEALFRRSISLEKIKLKKDDMLLIYTDGVTEAMNEKREQFGEDRLIEVIREHGHLHPTEFIKTLEAEIKGFTGGNAQNDDITVVAVKEKLTADDVLFGIRKKLIDMVDVEGLSVKDACAKMKVSPTTYYRYKKRMELLGERGLRNKVLRQDMDLKRVSIEERKKILEIIRQHPEYGAKRIAEEYNKDRGSSKLLTARMVYDELKRLNMNTKELRIDYLRRNRLLDEEAVPRKSSREVVEEFLSEVKSDSEEVAPKEEVKEEVEAAEGFEAFDEFEEIEEPMESESASEPLDLSEPTELVQISVAQEGEDVTVMTVNGHLDSVSSSILEGRLEEVIAEGHHSIIVDLSKVTYISSGGWGIIVGEVRKLRERSGDVVLVGMTSEVYDVYELLGFSEILRSFTDVSGGLEYFSKPPEERFAPQREHVSEVGFEGLDQVSESVGGVDDLGVSGEWESLRIEAATVGEKGDIAVLSLIGIIDTISAEKLRAAIDKVISNEIFRIVVDMSVVEYVSSGGWGTFTERLREVRRRDGDIKLFGMDPDVYYVFTMLGFNIVLSSFDILTEAIEDFDRVAEGRPSVHPHHEKDAFATKDVPVIEMPEERDEVPHDVFGSVAKPSGKAVSKLVDWEAHDGIMLATIHGQIDATTIEAIEAVINSNLSSTSKFLVFDLADVDYISSTGWGSFAKYHRRLANDGGCVSLSGMSAELYEVFRCLEFHSFITSYPSREDAQNGCREMMQKGVSPVGGPPKLPSHTPQTADDGRLPEIEKASWDEEDDRSEAEAVEDILGTEEVPTVESSDSGASDWPEVDEEPVVGSAADSGIEVSPPSTGDGDARADWLESEAPAEPTKPDPFVDFERKPSQVDVDMSVTDEHVEQDHKLRRIGWSEYGKRLRKKIARKPKEEES